MPLAEYSVAAMSVSNQASSQVYQMKKYEATTNGVLDPKFQAVN